MDSTLTIFAGLLSTAISLLLLAAAWQLFAIRRNLDTLVRLARGERDPQSVAAPSLMEMGRIK